MINPLLTIGMPHYDDFHGAFFTIQHLRFFHSEIMNRCEIIVVDNNPKSSHGHELKTFIESKVPNGRYIEHEDSVGTSCAKNRVFEEARGEIVLCIDCHIFIDAGAIAKLIEYYREHPETNDLLSGPLIYNELQEYKTGPNHREWDAEEYRNYWKQFRRDNSLRDLDDDWEPEAPDKNSYYIRHDKAQGFTTHFNDIWGSEMRGQWAKDERGIDPDGEPFEIDAMGCGLLSCRREAWLGFNKHFRGFGGEEWYIHDKFRNAGFKCICLPFLRWPHRFGNPDPRNWPLQLFDKLRNHLIGHNENSTPLDCIEEHFVETEKINLEEWNRLVTDPITATKSIRPRIEKQPANSCGGGNSDSAVSTVTSLEEFYELACNNPSDINEHAPKLRELSEQCDHVTEFGMRHGVSTVALLAGQPKRFITYDLNDDSISGVLKRYQGETEFDFLQGNSLAVEIEETDMLFIDTKHTADHLYAELDRHASHVRRWIVLHDQI